MRLDHFRNFSNLGIKKIYIDYMPIQIIDNFELTTTKPLDNRLVVGTSSFYKNKDDIQNKYSGLRIWELPGSLLTGGGTNNTSTGLGYVWTGSSWISENTTAISGGGTTNTVPVFNTSNSIQSSPIWVIGGTKVGIGTSASNNSHALNVTGNLNATSFSGNGSSITNLNADNLTGTINVSRLPGSTTGFILTADNANSASYKIPSSITVGTASALQTTRTIWGQPFNGTGNVSGNITFGTQTNKATISYNVDSNRTLTVPTLSSSNSTFAFLEQAQTFTANQTMGGNLVVTGTTTLNGNSFFNGQVRINSNDFAVNSISGFISTERFSVNSNGIKMIKSVLDYLGPSVDIEISNGDGTSTVNISSVNYDRIIYLGTQKTSSHVTSGSYSVEVEIDLSIIFYQGVASTDSANQNRINFCFILPANKTAKYNITRNSVVVSNVIRIASHSHRFGRT
jgi:hypothetical protein